MELSSELVSQFVKSTNDRGTEQKEIIVYGSIVTDGTNNYAQLDGSSELAPISSTVEVSPGDRVIVTVKNHTATVTGNTTDPAIGTRTANGITSSIRNLGDRLEFEVSNEEGSLGSKITMLADKIESTVFDEANGLISKIEQMPGSIISTVKADYIDPITVVIDGENGLTARMTKAESTIEQLPNSIKSSVKAEYIDAINNAISGEGGIEKRLTAAESSITQLPTSIEATVKATYIDPINGQIEAFTTFKQTGEGWDFIDSTNGTISIKEGAITWKCLDNDAQKKVTDAENTATSAWNRSDTALETANGIKGIADSAYELASKNKRPDYLQDTYISKTTIMSPTIVGAQFWAVEEDSRSYLTMKSDGIAIYEAGIEAPRVLIANNEDNVQLVLGAGTYTNPDYTNGRFYIDKTTSNTSIYYHSATTNGKIGFTFNNDGTITVLGKLNGVTSSVTAVWG